MAKKEVKAKALVNIKHDGVYYKQTEEFIVSEKVGTMLAGKGYVEVIGKVKPTDTNNGQDDTNGLNSNGDKDIEVSSENEGEK